MGVVFQILGLSFLTMFFLVLGLYPTKKIDLKELYDEAEDTELRTGVILMLTPFTKQLEEFNAKYNGKRIQQYREFIKKRLSMCGNPFRLNANEFLGFQEILFGSMLMFFCIFLLKMPEGALIQKVIFVMMLIVIAFLLSFILPIVILTDAVKKRHKKLSRELPYILDLLTVSVEAGLDFVMAIKRVIEKGAPGPLKREFKIMMQQIKLGKRRKEALQDMSDRNGLPDLKTIVASMIQADQMGASLGPILRIQSDMLRKKRMLLAEKIAQQAPVKMLMPLIGCIFPAVFLILLVPIILKLITSI